MKFLKKTITILIALFLVWLIAFNIRLYYQPQFVTHGKTQVNQDVLNQLIYLKEKMHNGAAAEMQQIFPEGHLFLNALYGLTWIELAANFSPGEKLYEEAHGEIDWVLEELYSKEGRAPFNHYIQPSYGVFFRGWTNYVLGRKLTLLSEKERDPADVKQFQLTCASIMTALEKSNTPILESYAGRCWPADMVVGMASVAIHEKLFPGAYAEAIQKWLANMDAKTDELGLMPHASDAHDGSPLGTSRGSSQSLILNFLIEIDPVYARKKFKIYKENFLDYRAGLPGIREYPKGTPGAGDIDSGPVIFGIGGSGSIVGQRAMALYGETDVTIGLRNSIEAFGIGKTISGKKNYLFGYLPIADAFMAWSNSIESNPSQHITTDKSWRRNTQLISLVLLVLGVGFLWRQLKSK